MSDDRKRRPKGGDTKIKQADAVVARKNLSDCVLNTWRDLRPALEVGAADDNYITSMESTADEKTCVNLKLTNPRT